MGGGPEPHGPRSAAGITATPSGRRYANWPVVTITRSSIPEPSRSRSQSRCRTSSSVTTGESLTSIPTQRPSRRSTITPRIYDRGRTSEHELTRDRAGIDGATNKIPGEWQMLPFVEQDAPTVEDPLRVGLHQSSYHRRFQAEFDVDPLGPCSALANSLSSFERHRGHPDTQFVQLVVKNASVVIRGAQRINHDQALTATSQTRASLLYVLGL